MSALKLIDDVRTAGGTIQLINGKLIARNIPAVMLKQLRSVKPEIVALLAANDEPRPTPGSALFVNPLPEHQLEVVAMLRADSNLRYAFVTKHEGDSVIVTLAVRDVAVCDLTIPASRYDPLTFWKTINEVTHD